MHNRVLKLQDRPLGPNRVGVKYSLIVLEGGGGDRPCLCFYLLICQKGFHFILNWNFRYLSWLGYLFNKAVLLLCALSPILLGLTEVQNPKKADTVQTKTLFINSWSTHMKGFLFRALFPYIYIFHGTNKVFKPRGFNNKEFILIFLYKSLK